MSPSKIERRTLVTGVLVALVIVAVGLVAAVASAQESAKVATGSSTTSATVPVTSSTVATVSSAPATGAAVTSVTVSGGKGYALDFTLPTFGKSGCLVCHGDPNLVVAKGDSTHSYWIDEQAYGGSAHAGIVCTACHLDYGYSTPHGQSDADWRSVAKQACKNCHEKEYNDWNLGAHAITPAGIGVPDPNASRKPTCGDCHGSHDIQRLKNNPAGRAALRASAQQMCGRSGCHADYFANWNDYYHGAAYKKGATDAPSCWTCHGAHLVLKSSDKDAPMNTANLGGTNACGTPGCHQGAGPGYASYAPMIHGRDKAVSANPIVRFLASVFSRK